tara:strand:- start:1829 stop:2830 length:1002 start_codon:yes stop_codon:yes gene_type:complete
MASSYSNLHPVDQILTSLVQEAVPSDDQLIADKIFETVSIPERSGTLLLEETRNFMGAGAGLDLQRAPGASRASIGGFDRSSQTFMAKIYGAQDSIAMEDIFDSQYPGSEEERIARKVARVIKLAREKRAADLLFGTANFNNDTSTNEFGSKFNAAGAEPLANLHQLKDTLFEAAHGINPDSLIFGRKLFRELARNPEVRGFVGSTANGLASGNRVLNDEVVINVLRDVLGIPNIFVGQARQDTAVPGATSSEAYIWTEDSLFMGILKGSDAIVQKSGNVKGMPVAALSLSYNEMVAGQYDSLDKTRRYVYAEEVGVFHAVDSTLGRIITDCL